MSARPQFWYEKPDAARAEALAQWRAPAPSGIGRAMAIRAIISAWAVGGLVLIAGCGEPRSGPIMVSAIGEPPELVNPNLQPLDAPSAALLQATAQGLVRFDAVAGLDHHFDDVGGTADHRIDFTAVSPEAIWAVQVVAIVGGHLAGLALAHDRALAAAPRWPC